MKTLALCSNILEFDAGSLAWNDVNVTAKYPGSAWISYLEAYANEQGHQVLSGSHVIDCVDQREIDPKDVYIIQEEMNSAGLALLARHCVPAVVMCLESPLFAPLFYDAIPDLKRHFKAQILFGKLGTHQAYFPSFDYKWHMRKAPEWESRKEMLCMVNSNKHYRVLYSSPELLKSHSYQHALGNQLHDFRYSSIDLLVFKTGMMDLYGKGWANSPEIPPGQKIEVLSRYKYNFCPENMTLQGYVTEKLIDSLVAGTIPIYYGAPDIDDYVPRECFLNKKLQGPATVQAGRMFLTSDKGYKFSYQAFAKQVLEIIL